MVEKLVAATVVVTLLTLQNVIGANAGAKRLSSEDTENLPWNLTDDFIRPERNAYRRNKWINGIVPYTIDPKFTSADRTMIEKAFREYASKTCIRFVPKTSKHFDYVDIQLELDNKFCGEAIACRGGGKQYAKIGRRCMGLHTILHELGHSICLAHEHQREDRDDFITLTDKADKNDRTNYVKGDSTEFTTLGLLYDYESVMHYSCPYFFLPKTGAVKSCGKGEKLSVLDVEKINALYNCGGCHSYRFRQFQQAGEDVANMGYDIDGKTLGVCRGYMNADIIPGKYRLGSAECHIPYENKEYKLTKNFEVLTLPQSKLFSWVTVKNGQVPANAVPGGRENGGIPLYIGSCHTRFNAKNTRVPGKIHQGKIYISFGGKEYTCGKFEVLVCNAGS